MLRQSSVLKPRADSVGKVQYRSQAKVRTKEASLWEGYPSYPLWMGKACSGGSDVTDSMASVGETHIQGEAR